MAVSIADVAEHVQAGSLDDRQAHERAFTRYQTETSDPMLPLKLAEDGLSLLPGAVRNTLTFRLDLDMRFEVTGLAIEKTQLKSDAQLTYDEVSEILNTPEHPCHGYWGDALELAYDLLEQRQQRGALAVFDPVKSLRSTEEGKLLSIPEGASHRAYLIVQELMILVNHTVTAHLLEQGLTLLFRNHTTIHSDMRERYLSELEAFLHKPSPEMLEQINQQMARLLERAHYSPVNRGHVGLGLACYAHWTSPIRRYADLVNHRLLRAWLDDQAPPYSPSDLEAIGTHIGEVVERLREAHFLAQERELEARLHQSDETVLAEFDSQEMTGLIAYLESGEVEWCPSRVAEIRRRLNDDALSTPDILRLLFAPSGEACCSGLREETLSWLTHHSAEVFIVFDLGHRFYGWPASRELEWDVSQQGPSHIPTFSVEVSMVSGAERVKVSPKDITSQTAVSGSKREAEQWALLSLLSRLAGLDLTLPESISQAAVEELTLVQPAGSPLFSPKSRVLEIAQALKQAVPTFTLSEEGPLHGRHYTCVGFLQLADTAYESAPQIGKSKKEAERLAALDILSQLPNEVVNEQAEKEQGLQLTPGKNPVSALQEWVTRNAYESPLYSFDCSGPPHGPVFVCTCEVSTTEWVKLWQGVGASKKAAKAAAAEAACQSLLGACGRAEAAVQMDAAN